MPQNNLLRVHVRAELAAARNARTQGDIERTWHHLERAHILAQPSAWMHTHVHGSMWMLALVSLDLRELAGQTARLLVAGLGSLLGRYPVGNTGRARVPMSMPMRIPDDLQLVLRQAGATA